jgi:hypothetical protein
MDEEYSKRNKNRKKLFVLKMESEWVILKSNIINVGKYWKK